MGAEVVDKTLTSVRDSFIKNSKAIDKAAGGKQASSKGGFDEAARKAKQLEKEKQTAQKATAKEASKLEKDLAKEKEQNRKKEEREKIQSIKRIETEERRATRDAAKEIERTLKQQEQAKKRFARGLGTSVTGSAGKVLGGAMSLGGTALGLIGGLGAVESVREAANNESSARDLNLFARDRGGKQFTDEQLRKSAHTTGTAFGFSQSDVLSANKAFLSVRGTTLEQAQNSQGRWATAARAAGNGTTVEDVAKFEGNLSKMGISKPADVESIVASTINQSRKSGLSFGEFSEHSSSLIQKGKAFGLTGAEGINSLTTLAGLSHAAKPEEAEGAVDNLFKTLTEKSKDLASGKLLGSKVNVFDKDNQARNPLAVINDVVAAAKGNQRLIQEALGAKGGSTVAADLTSAYNTAAGSTKGSKGDKEKAGRAASESLLNNLMQNSGDFGGIQKDAAEQMQTTTAKLASLQEKLAGAIGDELLPLLPELITDVTKLIPAISALTKDVVKFAEWAEGNPWEALIAIMGAAFVKDIVAAQIGKAIESTIADGAQAFGRTANAGAASMAGLGLAAAGASLALMAVADQNEELKKVTGGMGALDLMKGMWDKGTFDPQEVVDDAMNAKAKVERAAIDKKAKEDSDKKLADNTAATKELTAAIKDNKPSSLPKRTPNPVAP